MYGPAPVLRGRPFSEDAEEACDVVHDLTGVFTRQLLGHSWPPELQSPIQEVAAWHRWRGIAIRAAGLAMLATC